MGDGAQGRQRHVETEDLQQPFAARRDTLREEMEYLGPVKLSAVEQVQQQIVDVIRRLQDSGELSVNTGEEEEQLIS